jgi:hypothetical protein
MAKADPGKYEGPIAARYGDRLKQAAINVTSPTPRAEPVPAKPEEEKVIELPNRRPERADQYELKPRPAATAAESTSIRVIVTTAEREELDTLLNSLSKAVGARVKLANVMRASISQLLNAEDQIVARALKARDDFGTRPANADALALARFEDRLRDVVEAGLVDAARKSRG